MTATKAGRFTRDEADRRRSFPVGAGNGSEHRTDTRSGQGAAATKPRPIIHPVIPKRITSKSTLDRICSELALLRKEVALLRDARAASQPAAPDVTPISDREAARQKRIAEREAAKIAHTEFLAKEAAAQPEKDRKLAEWAEAEKKRIRARDAAKARKYYASHKDKLVARQAAVRARRKASPEQVQAEKDRKRKYYLGNRKDILAKTAARSRRHQEAKKQIHAGPDLRGGPL